MIPADLHTTASVKFEPRDIWVGLFWTHRRSIESQARWLELYICIIPMLPIHIEFSWGWKIQDKEYDAYCQSSWDKGLTAMGYRDWKEKRSKTS